MKEAYTCADFKNQTHVADCFVRSKGLAWEEVVASVPTDARSSKSVSWTLSAKHQLRRKRREVTLACPSKPGILPGGVCTNRGS